jgi:hypothetical protein
MATGCLFILIYSSGSIDPAMGLIPRRNRFRLYENFLSDTLRKRESEAVLRIRDPVPDYWRQLRKLGRTSEYICCAALFLLCCSEIFFFGGGGVL